MVTIKQRTTQKRKRHKGCNHTDANQQNHIKRPANLPIKEKILPQNNHHNGSRNQNEEMYDERNPDVIPSTNGMLFFIAQSFFLSIILILNTTYFIFISFSVYLMDWFSSR